MVDAVVVQEKKIAVGRQIERTKEIDGGVELLRSQAFHLVQLGAEVLLIPIGQAGRVLRQRFGSSLRCLRIAEYFVKAEIIDALQELHIRQRNVLGEFAGGAPVLIKFVSALGIGDGSEHALGGL